KVLLSMGISVPGEISVVGFDDIETARSVMPELTTMRVQKELMGKKAVCKLIERIDIKDDTAEKILLCANLIQRQSVKNI
ncbi:MAG TPA: substrate-binding domain-containing protein, partial [Ruminiclostridium sp.]|nr:substrate-binding domain-containing protein [Ruminiclostridium sp.]